VDMFWERLINNGCEGTHFALGSRLDFLLHHKNQNTL